MQVLDEEIAKYMNFVLCVFHIYIETHYYLWINLCCWVFDEKKIEIKKYILFNLNAVFDSIKLFWN